MQIFVIKRCMAKIDSLPVKEIKLFQIAPILRPAYQMEILYK